MTRIRYEKDDHGTLFTKAFVLPNGNEIIISIDPNGTVMYNELGHSSILVEGPMSLEAAKKAAKRSLVTLGVNFENEVRPRTTKSNKEKVLKEFQDSIMEDENNGGFRN